MDQRPFRGVLRQGDSAFVPDGRILGSVAELRAERDGEDNGRVYTIHFTAEDEYGGTCEGTVTVGVPHDASEAAVDDAPPYYDSTASGG